MVNIAQGLTRTQYRRGVPCPERAASVSDMSRLDQRSSSVHSTASMPMQSPDANFYSIADTLLLEWASCYHVLALACIFRLDSALQQAQTPFT